MANNPIVDWLLDLAKTYAITGIKRTLKKNQERIAHGVTVVGVELSKAVLARETQRMVNSQDPKAVSAGLFIEFMTGVGPAERDFGPDSVVVKHMKNAPGVLAAKEYFYKTRFAEYQLNKKAPGALSRKPLTDYSAGFNPLTGPIKAGTDIVEQFVGTFEVEIFPNLQGTQMKIVCTNKTSVHSFLYHLPFVENYERSGGLLPTPMGNILQTISWTEPIDNTRFEAHTAQALKKANEAMRAAKR